MSISLCQFYNTSAELLLEMFKKHAKRVVIIEDVFFSLLRRCSFLMKLKHYLCAYSEYIPRPLFTYDEFVDIMNAHQYDCIKSDQRYVCGIYEG